MYTLVLGMNTLEPLNIVILVFEVHNHDIVFIIVIKHANIFYNKHYTLVPVQLYVFFCFFFWTDVMLYTL